MKASQSSIYRKLEKLKELDVYLAGIKRFGVDEAYVLDHYLMSLNSYMGFFIDKATYALRRRAVKRYCHAFLIIT